MVFSIEIQHDFSENLYSSYQYLQNMKVIMSQKKINPSQSNLKNRREREILIVLKWMHIFKNKQALLSVVAENAVIHTEDIKM